MNIVQAMQEDYDESIPRIVFLDTSVLIAPLRHEEKTCIRDYKRILNICRNELIITPTVSHELYSAKNDMANREKKVLSNKKNDIKELITSTRELLLKLDAPNDILNLYSEDKEHKICTYLQS